MEIQKIFYKKYKQKFKNNLIEVWPEVKKYNHKCMINFWRKNLDNKEILKSFNKVFK